MRTTVSAHFYFSKYSFLNLLYGTQTTSVMPRPLWFRSTKCLFLMGSMVKNFFLKEFFSLTFFLSYSHGFVSTPQIPESPPCQANLKPGVSLTTLKKCFKRLIGLVSYRTTFPILLLNSVSFLLSSFCGERKPGWRDAFTVTSV